MQLASVQSAVSDHGELVAHGGHSLPQSRGGPHSGCRRIVQLMCEPCRQRRQGQQPLALIDDGIGRTRTEEQALQQVKCHREPCAYRGREIIGRQYEELGIGDSPHGVGIPLLDAVPEVRASRPAVHTALVGAGDFHLVAVQHTAERDRSAEQHEEARGPLALRVHHASGRQLLRTAAFCQPVELLVAELLEQEQSLQLRR